MLDDLGPLWGCGLAVVVAVLLGRWFLTKPVSVDVRKEDACRFCGTLLSSASSHAQLTANLQENGMLCSAAAKTAFGSVDRGAFVIDAEDADSACVAHTCAWSLSLQLNVHAAARSLTRRLRRTRPPPVAPRYDDAALVLGAGSMMSAPHVHAHALDMLAEGLCVRSSFRRA